MWAQLAGAEVELEGGQKLSAKLVVLGDGVHSKTANKYHKMALTTVDIAAWRYTSYPFAFVPSHLKCVDTCITQIQRIRAMHCSIPGRKSQGHIPLPESHSVSAMLQWLWS